MRTLRAILLAAIALVALGLPATAMAQATRTWVSGTGDDANPCSRTAPCKTFVGAINKTAEGGEINAIDPGGYGGVTITKSITIRSEGALAGVLVSGTNAIVVNAGPTDFVVLDGLDVNGLGSSLSAIKILSARSVRVENSEIYGFRAGIALVPTSQNTRLVVNDTRIFENGVGIIHAPVVGADAASSGSAEALIENSRIESNTCGVVVSSRGANASTPDSNNACGAGAGSPTHPAKLALMSSSASYNTNGGLVADGSGAAATFGRDTITGNGIGLLSANGGILRSLGDNAVFDNTVDGEPTERRKRTRCRTKLISAGFGQTAARATATLSSGRRILARGTAKVTRTQASVTLNRRSSLRPGVYTLKIARRGKVIARGSVLVR
jgi:hypothetical protein